MRRRSLIFLGAWVVAVLAIAPFGIELLDGRRWSRTTPGLPVTVSEILMIVGLILLGALLAVAVDRLLRR